MRASMRALVTGCDNRSLWYWKNCGWSTLSHSANHGCDRHQGAMSITSPVWVVLSFWMTSLSRGNGGNLYIDLPCQSCDKASIASARGSGTGDMNWGRCVLWTVANMFTTGVPHSLNIRIMTSGWRLHSVMMGWFGRDNRSAFTFKQPGMCLFWVWSHRNRSTTSRNRRWEWVPPCLLMWATTVVLSVAIKIWRPCNTVAQWWRANITALSSSTLMWSSCSERVHTHAIWESTMWAPQSSVKASMKMVNSAWYMKY